MAPLEITICESRILKAMPRKWILIQLARHRFNTSFQNVSTIRFCYMMLMLRSVRDRIMVAARLESLDFVGLGKSFGKSIRKTY